MTSQPKKGRFISDTLKPWHMVLLILMAAALLIGQYALNQGADKERLQNIEAGKQGAVQSAP